MGSTVALSLRRLALAAAIAFAALLTAHGGSSGEPTNVQGAVYSWASANPGEGVPLLVEHDSRSDALADLVLALGGTVERRFRIVPVLSVTLPADTISSLTGNPAVFRVSLDAPVMSTGFIDVSNLATAYPFAVNADRAWSQGLTGRGIGVAIVDTGISPSGHEDFRSVAGSSRVVAQVGVNPLSRDLIDRLGHGTHVAGIVGGDGSRLNGKYIGVAPEANLINVKVAGEDGSATLGGVIAGLEWIYDNRATYNIRVVNLSLTSSVAQSYRVDPLDAAVEALWFNGVLVVVAAGNLGSAPGAVDYPPANDPYVLTVGATDDKATRQAADDEIAAWSSRGLTQDGFFKPELVAPGRGIVSVIDTNSALYRSYPEKVVDKEYFRFSGTSMAAPIVSGVAALVLQRHPEWRPGQLKCTLVESAVLLSRGEFRVPLADSVADRPTAGGDCDAGLSPNLLVEASGGGAAEWDSIKWDSVKWDSIKWESIKWDALVE